MSNKRMWFGGMVDLGSRVIGSGTITNSEKLSISSRGGISSIVEFKLNKWNSHSFLNNEMRLSKIGRSVSRFMDTGINFG